MVFAGIFLIPCVSASSITLTSGDCDGRNDHVEINQALEEYDEVILQGPYTFQIGDSLLLDSDTVLRGRNKATLKLSDGLSGWGYRKCSIENTKAMLMIDGNSAENVKITGLTIDGNSENYKHIRPGTSQFTMMNLIGCYGLTIKKCTFKNGLNDAILVSDSSYVWIDNIRVDKPGHDGVSAYNVEYIIVENSEFTNRINSGCRFSDVSCGMFGENYCTTSGGGYAGVELQGDLDRIIITDNTFEDLPVQPVIQRDTEDVSNVIIESNEIINCGGN